MRYSQKWWLIVALLFAFALTVSVLTAQTEEPSAVNAPSSAKVQSDSAEIQSSSDEPKQEQPTLTPDSDTAAAKVKTELLNELRRELLDDRAKVIDWWLAAAAIFLTLLGVAAAILGYFGFKRLDRIENEARENMEESEKHAKEAQRYQEEAQRDLEKIRDEAQRNLEEIKARRGEADSLVEGMNAKVAGSDPDKASEVVENVQQNPESSLIDRSVAAALSLQQNKQIDEAIKKWRSIANVVEGINRELEAQAWFSIGYLSSTRDEPDLDAAINAYDVALRLNPSNAEAYNNRGNVKDDLGQYEAAIADYDAALRLNPNYADAYHNRSIAKSRRGQYEAAIADCDAALRLNPNYADAYNNRGVAKGLLSQYEAAIADYDAALRLNPNYADAYNNRGISKDKIGRPDEAIADYDVALRLNPNYADAYYNRGLAELKLNRIDAARQNFETALNLAQATGNADLAAQAAQALDNLDRADAP